MGSNRFGDSPPGSAVYHAIHRNTDLTLGQKQELFALLFAHLVLYAYERGYGVRHGEVKRDPRVAQLNSNTGAGISNSLHLLSLAGDLNLFRGAEFLTRSEDHTELGTYWKSLHPLCRWGGDFKPKPDGNHYSIEHEGRK